MRRLWGRMWRLRRWRRWRRRRRWWRCWAGAYTAAACAAEVDRVLIEPLVRTARPRGSTMRGKPGAISVSDGPATAVGMNEVPVGRRSAVPIEARNGRWRRRLWWRWWRRWRLWGRRWRGRQGRVERWRRVGRTSTAATAKVAGKRVHPLVALASGICCQACCHEAVKKGAVAGWQVGCPVEACRVMPIEQPAGPRRVVRGEDVWINQTCSPWLHGRHEVEAGSGEWQPRRRRSSP